jgi:hypothetical protein
LANIPKHTKWLWNKTKGHWNIPSGYEICQMVITYQKDKKYPNGHKISKSREIYQNFIFHGLPKCKTSGCFVCKIYHLATLHWNVFERTTYVHMYFQTNVHQK